jgi:hypothetical protein
MGTAATILELEPGSLPFELEALQTYLTQVFGSTVRVLAVESLGSGEPGTRLKEFGYGEPLLIRVQQRSAETQVVMHTMPGDEFGHDRPSDRARNLLLDYATYNRLPHHVRSLDVGAFVPGGRLLSLGEAGEFFHLTEFAPGRTYAQDLFRIAETGTLTARDLQRSELLADYLATIHAVKHDDPACYRRRVRDLIGLGEGVMGLLDSYPTDLAVALPDRLERIEQACVAWRWRIKARSHRLSQVHGDFHPWNVLFQDEDQFMLLDRSRGEWGEPADDLSAMTINYMLFSLRQVGSLSGPFADLFDRFWTRYLDQTGDDEALAVIAPFYAWRSLVIAHPLWYPSLSLTLRDTLLRFAERVLAAERFDPARAAGYVAAAGDRP